MPVGSDTSLSEVRAPVVRVDVLETFVELLTRSEDDTLHLRPQRLNFHSHGGSGYAQQQHTRERDCESRDHV